MELFCRDKVVEPQVGLEDAKVLPGAGVPEQPAGGVQVNVKPDAGLIAEV